MPMKKNDLIELEITDVTGEGQGVGRTPEGLAVFVPMTAVGDYLTVRIVKILSRYAYGIVERLNTQSSDRIVPDCDVFTRCGGCQYRHITYEAELRLKQRQVFETFARIGEVRFAEQRILPSPLEQGYRNKAQYPVRATADGRCAAGFFAQRSHRLVEAENCRLHPPVFGKILNAILEFANQNGIKPYNEMTGKGLLRHIFLRSADATGELMVCLVINGDSLAGAERLVKTLTTRFPQIKSIELNTNKAETNVILGGKCVTIYGDGAITDILRGVKVRLSPLSFYQVNRLGAEQLYAAAEEFAAPQEAKLLVDLYCGAGTIGLSIANRVEKLIGVEIVAEAIENAKQNAAANGFGNCEFICADASKASQLLAGRGLKPDVVILDPPRKGSDYDCLAAVAKMQPDRIVMISCNPATAARDVKILCQEFGYTAQKAVAVDMFPRTGHVETVVLMLRVEKQG